MDSQNGIKIKLDTSLISIIPPKKFVEFIGKLKEIFGTNLPKCFRIQYKDFDGDSIIVTTSEDYEIALEEAIKSPEFCFSIEKLSDDETHNSIILSPEDLSKNTDNIPKPIPEKIDPISKQDPLIKENTLNTNKIDAESILISKDKISDNKAEPCFSCHGTAKNKKGLTCKKCNGTGIMDPIIKSMKKHIEKTLRAEMSKIIQNEISKSFLEQSKRFDSIFSNMGKSIIIEENVKCTNCKNEILAGEAVFSCMICQNFKICENCEENINHEHALIKGRKSGEKFDYKMELIDSTILKGKLKPNTKNYIIWTIKNIGKKAWPKNIELIPINKIFFESKCGNIGEIQAGEKCDILVEFISPKIAGNYMQEYQLSINGKNFGQTLKLIFQVQNADEEEKKEIVKEAIKPIVQPSIPKINEIKMKIEKYRKADDFDKKYEDNLIKIMNMGDWEIMDIMRFLRKNDNNIEQTLLDLTENK